MQVYLPAIKGDVPYDVVGALHAFLEFCYIAWQNVQDTQSLAALSDALDHFHKYWIIFTAYGVQTDSLHYLDNILLFII